MTNWDIVRGQAVKSLQSKSEWTSFVKKRKYKVHSINDNSFIIEKVSGGLPVKLTQTIIENAIKKIKENKRLGKTELLPSVSRETALITLHPCLHWDGKSKEVFWDESSFVSLGSVSVFIANAEDDNLENVQRLVRLRKNQSKFRKSMLAAYGGRCCVSKCDIEAVLEAAHIESHSSSGVNQTNNGLLLRSDLHILFDEHLLVVHPDKLTVHLHPSLATSTYARFEGIAIQKRIDNVIPKREFLEARSQAAQWPWNAV